MSPINIKVSTAHEMVWLCPLQHDLGVPPETPTPMYCNNLAVIFNVGNSTFHEQIKHLESDCRLVHDMILQHFISVPHVASST